MKHFLLVITLLLFGCQTEMGAKGIRRLTTCKTHDLEEIKGNLLAHGFEIVKETPTMLETDYKFGLVFQDMGGTRMIRVNKSKDGTISFKTFVPHSSSGGDGMAIFALATAAIDRDHIEETYYEESRKTYEVRKKLICGD